MSSRPSRVVFVANIPYDFSEEQLIDIFKEVGHVETFRLVFDKDTGKPKGFGFCTYPDSETASSAVRNLNGYEIHGRAIRVDFAESEKDPADEKRGGDKSSSMGQPPSSSMSSSTAALSSSSSSVDQIQATLSSLSPDALIEVLQTMQVLATTQPHQARALLQQSPQLGYALFHILLMMNLINADIVNSVMTKFNQPAAAPQPPVMSLPIPQPAPLPIPSLPPAPAPLPLPTGAQPQFPPHIGDQEKQLILQILQMNPQDIEKLPPQQKQQLMAIRAQFLPPGSM